MISIFHECSRILRDATDADIDAIELAFDESFATWTGSFLGKSSPEDAYGVFVLAWNEATQAAVAKAKSLAGEREQLETERLEGDPHADARAAMMG